MPFNDDDDDENGSQASSFLFISFFQQNNVCLYKKVSYSNKSFDLSLVNFFCVWTIRTMPFDLIKRFFFLFLYCSPFVWNFNCKLSNENKTKKLYKRKKWNKVVNLLFDVSVVTLLLLLLGFFYWYGKPCFILVIHINFFSFILKKWLCLDDVHFSVFFVSISRDPISLQLIIQFFIHSVWIGFSLLKWKKKFHSHTHWTQKIKTEILNNFNGLLIYK